MKATTETQENHPNQIFGQIILPFLLFLALVAIGGYLLFSRVASGGADLRMSSDISTMIVFLPLILISPIFLVMIMMVIALISAFQEKIKGLFGKINPVILKISTGAANLAHFISRPVIAAKTGFSWFTNRK